MFLSFIRVKAPSSKGPAIFREAWPQRMMGNEEKAFEASIMEAGSADGGGGECLIKVYSRDHLTKGPCPEQIFPFIFNM